MSISYRLAFILFIITALLCACSDEAALDAPSQRVIVIGVDGMDYAMTARLMAQGKLPSFTRLSEQGSFQALATSVPPLSPVAWSDFMTGMDSGGHGIFDFLQRDPQRMVPEFSMSKAEPPSRHISMGSWKFPLAGGQVVNLREGKVFWQALRDSGVHSSIIRMPANYPPVGVAERELSGMGTPDLRGSYGIFTFITTEFNAARKRLDGGEMQEVWEENGVIQAVLTGPPHPFKNEKTAEPLELPLEIVRDRHHNRALLRIDGQEIELGPQQWSPWVPVEFVMLPYWPLSSGSLHGMVRFYLRSVTPELELYVSPINFDPLKPDTTLSKPADFASELAEQTGRFYTQGLPEDTKALEEGILTRKEFIEQAELSANDVLAQLDLLVEHFLHERRSFLFYYLGHLDQVSHMLWKSTDPQHPAYDPQTDPKWAAKLEQLYIETDELVGQLADRIGDSATLIVMSDHGFASWRREMDLNGWLRKNGYLVLKPGRSEGRELFIDVDWSRTRAYGLGFNGLYLNLAGREKDGIVAVTEKDSLLDELRQALLAEIDPATGEAAVSKVYRSEEHFQNRGALQRGPDLIVGYNYGTRVASRSALGAVANSKNILTDHLDHWSGDHAMDHETVPGILLSNQILARPVNNLRELSAAIVAIFKPETSDE